MLLLVLLTGKKPFSSEYSKNFDADSWVQNRIKNNRVNEIVDPAITRNGVTTIEDIQMRASAHLAISCITSEADYRPTMVEVATELKNMITSPEFIPTATNFQENGLYQIFYGSEEYFTQNRALVSRFSFWLLCYRGTWEGKAVLVRLSDHSFYNGDETRIFREIVVATKTFTHNNVHKLLGCCLETKLPVLVYEWVAAETLNDRILCKDENHCRLPPLEWKDRLRIAWEISDVVSYLHTAFPKPIIHGSLYPGGFIKPHNIFLYQDNTVKLSSIFYSLQKGEDVYADVYSDVYSFGMLFLELLAGKKEEFLSTSRGEQYEERTDLVVWITEKIRLGNISEIVDPTITKNGVATTELSASIELALKCTTGMLNSPTMVDIATELNNIISSHDSIPCTSTFQGEGMYMIFRGCKEYHIQNESFIVEESNSLFPGKMKPIRYFSVDELCKMKVEYHRIFRRLHWSENSNWYRGSWEGNVVLVKLPKRVASDEARMRFLREILVATQMASHSNFQKLIGCCLETEYPVLVYESVAGETLKDRIRTEPVLEWKERLRIAWDISKVVSHLHNAFSRPIIHGYLKTDKIFLGLENTVKLSNFSRCISIPEGQNFGEDFGRSSIYMEPRRVAQCTDVYSFGILFQELLTGKSVDLVYEEFERIPSSNIVVDPAIAKNGVVTAEMTASIKLALKCRTKVDRRPTMVQVATELEKIIGSSDLPNNGFSLLRGCLTS